MGVVDAAVAPGVAAEQPPAGEDRPLQEPVLAQSVERVLRAGRVVLAAVPEQRADRPSVHQDQSDHRIPRGLPDKSGKIAIYRARRRDKPAPRKKRSILRGPPAA